MSLQIAIAHNRGPVPFRVCASHRGPTLFMLCSRRSIRSEGLRVHFETHWASPHPYANHRRAGTKFFSGAPFGALVRRGEGWIEAYVRADADPGAGEPGRVAGLRGAGPARVRGA